MNGDETLRVNLEKSVPAWILSGTAVVQEDSEVHFLEDIYGHDAASKPRSRLGIPTQRAEETLPAWKRLDGPVLPS
jgi:murein L,D-transpeptidase YcbB/YkuD